MILTNPTIEVKNVKFFRGHEGMQGLNADLFVDGKKITHVYDDCWGGGFQYDVFEPHKENNETLQSLFEYAKTVPQPSKDFPDLEMDLDQLIDNIINKQEQEKVDKKNSPEGLLKRAQKDMKKYIIVGENLSSYQTFWYKGHPLITLYPKNRQELYDKIKFTKCVDGKKILNTNLKELGIIE